MEVAIHAYLPQAFGITLGRLLSLGQVPLIYLGRFLNLVFFAMCVYVSVKLSPFGKMSFLGVALLPMTLELVSSLSYDTFPIGLSMVFTAYVLRLAYEKTEAGGRDVAVLAVLLALLAPCKMVYIPLAGLCFLIPREKFGTGKRYRIAVCAVIACMVVGVALVNLEKVLVYLQGTEDPVAWAGGAEGYSFSYMLKHPLHVAGVLLNTLVFQLPSYMNTMLGGKLGWLEHDINSTLILFLAVWTILTAFPVKEEMDGSTQICMPVPHRIGSAVICFCVLLATLLIMLLSWTPLSSGVVEGVQGRYFLPVLPVMLLAARSRRFTLEKNVDSILLFGYCVAHVLILQDMLTRF